MSSLASRFPSAHRLQVPSNSGPDPETLSPEELARFVEPYLGWVLLEMDTTSTDILIGEPESAAQGEKSRELLILGGEVAQIWLRNVRKTAP